MRLIGEGQLADAAEIFARLEAEVDRLGIAEPCLVAWARHAVAAHLASGREADAGRIVRRLQRSAKRLPCRWPRIASAVGTALLAERSGDHQGAEDHFQVALALHEEVELPLERVETLLEYGAYLRRSG